MQKNPEKLRDYSNSSLSPTWEDTVSHDFQSRMDLRFNPLLHRFDDWVSTEKFEKLVFLDMTMYKNAKSGIFMYEQKYNQLSKRENYFWKT